VHACLEGPEGGVYYRGKGEITNNESTVIVLQDYVEKLAYEFTIQITPIYNKKKEKNNASLSNENKDNDSKNNIENNIKNNKNKKKKTPIKSITLMVSEIENNSFEVYGKNVTFFWLVHGKRRDVRIDIEPDKEKAEVKGYGPYKWI
jgi:hypothetical protein